MRAVRPLIRVLEDDPVTEVRWAASLALGEIGSMESVPALIRALRDRDLYIRYGSVRSLAGLGWSPVDDEDHAYMRIAYQDWDSVVALGPGAITPLMPILKSDDPETRGAVTPLLEKTGALRGSRHGFALLQDPDSRVRW